MRLSLPLSAAAVLLALSASTPTATADVRDDASYFSADAVSKANETIKEIKREFQKDLVIETFRHAPADKPDATSADPKVKDRFFSEWTLQQAREEQVNGIYVLICKEPPYIKPAVGNRTHAMFSDEDRDRLGQILVDHFKKKDYDDGLLEAVRYVQTSLKAPDKQAERRPAGQNAPPTWPPPGGTNRPATKGFSMGGLGGLLCVGLVVIAVIAVIWMAISALGRAFHQGPVGYGPGGYGQGGYGPGGGMGGYGAPGGGGGFMSSVLGGLFGGAAGSWAYDRFFGGHSQSAPMPGYGQGPASAPEPPQVDSGYTAGGGGDFGGGGDVGGGGGDFGGGGGGDFGGGGGGGGGGDFGGGGGDAGGGGGF